MGISYLYKWIYNHYNHLIISPKYNSYEVLCIDLNGIIHSSCQYIYRYGIYHSYPKLFISNRYKFKLLISKIQLMILNYIKIYNPTNVIIFAMDGISPLMKTKLQRKRRFINNSNNEFNINNISVGTVFIEHITNHIYSFICTLKYKYEIYFSDYRTPGEAEYKIMNYINNYIDTNNNILIISKDSDVLLFSISSSKNIHISRNVSKNTIIDIYKLKTILNNSFTNLDDFIFLISVFLKNDYMNKIGVSSLEYIIYKYNIYINKYKNQYIIYNENIHSTHLINFLCEFNIYKDSCSYNNTIACSFVKSIYWIFNYFKKCYICSWNWYNSYLYISIDHIILCLLSNPYFFKEILFIKNEPLTPFEQLINILPYKDSYLLPFSLQSFINNDDIYQIPKYDKCQYIYQYNKISEKDKIRNIQTTPIYMYKKHISLIYKI